MSKEIIEDEVDRKLRFCSEFGWKEYHCCLRDNIYPLISECRRLREENAALKKYTEK